MYVALRPAPTAAPVATSTTPVADTTETSSTPTSLLIQDSLDTTTPAVEQPATNTPPETVPTPVATTSGFKTYRNEEWGFAFEYPSDWEVRIPAFGSKASLFNMAVEPTSPYNPEAILINITSKAWIDDALAKMMARGVEVHGTSLSNRPALTLNDKGSVGRDTTFTLVTINTNYYMAIQGVRDYKNKYDALLESFAIFATSTPSN